MQMWLTTKKQFHFACYLYVLAAADDFIPVDILLSGQSLSTDYCVNEACHTQTGGNFTYSIPLHATIPINSSLSLQWVWWCLVCFADSLAELSVRFQA